MSEAPGRAGAGASSSSTPRAIWLGLAAATTALAVRLLLFVDRFSVDVPIDDQWGLIDRVEFSPRGFWAGFVAQHGPHRVGLGGLMLGSVYRCFHLDLRVDAFASAGAVIGAAVLALAVQRKAIGALAWSAVAVPLVYLTLLQYEVFVGAHDSAHGPFPEFLVTAAALGLAIERLAPRLALLVVLNGLCMFTGFALFACPFLIVLMALDLVRAREGMRARRLRGAALAISVATVAAFFIDYHWRPASRCPVLHAQQPGAVLAFPIWMLGHAFGSATAALVRSRSPSAWVVSMAEYGVLSGVFLRAAWRTFTRPSEYLDRAVFLLAGFTLIFGVATAPGRACLGLVSSQVSRYVAYAAPGLFAIHLALTGWLPGSKSRLAAAAVMIGLLAFREERTSTDLPHVARLRDAQLAWARCYRESEDLLGCEQSTGIRIHPNPRHIHLAGSLARMKAENLSFFRDLDRGG